MDLKISDLYALSALRSRGLSPTLVTQAGGRAVWQFEATPELREVLAAYDSRTLQVDALTYSELVRASKAEAMRLRDA